MVRVLLEAGANPHAVSTDDGESQGFIFLFLLLCW
jgi:hypothetical protein